ncbi:uncharacterized protein LOC105436450 isoform X2 [Strongylocentrotus purpuratus]|nr:uncharacterized protein LOC105436450 isoform X2 [Strongylocentrotus purpuratus]
MADESQDDVDVTRDIISQWKTEALRDFLRRRGLKLGNRGDMIAWVFSAMTQGIAIQPSEVEKTRSRASTYRELLVFNDHTFPDPMSELDDGWIGEQRGMQYWPPTMYRDICMYLLNKDPASLEGRIMKDYKEGKAYSYFASSWLKEIFFNPMGDSPFCFLKSKCTPSQNIGAEPHEAWLLCQKDDGMICSAYCTCVAGLGQTCNHVAAMLFKLDHAFKSGLVNPACTSVANSWIATSKRVLPCRVKEVSWERHHYGKGLTSKPPKLVTPSSLRYSATEKRTSAYEQRQQLADIIRASMPSAVMLSYVQSEDYNPEEVNKGSPEDDLNTSHTLDIPTSPHPMLPLLQLASMYPTSTQFIQHLQQPTSTDINCIEKKTRGQASSDNWHHQRIGRVTSSIIHRAYTRVQSLKKNPLIDTSKLLQSIMRTSPIQTRQMRRGIGMEPKAKEAYKKIMKVSHTNVTFKECGLFISEELAYLGSSPDMLVKCDCHGQGVVEIKCPDIEEVPAVGKPTYIQESADGTPMLQEKHIYMSQVMMQMAVTKRKWCHFFVYCEQGSALLNIPFDETIWKKLRDNAKYFWESVVAPHIHVLSHINAARTQVVPTNADLQTTEQTAESSQVLSSNRSGSSTKPSLSSTSNQTQPRENDTKKRKKKTGKMLVRQKSRPVYMCSICDNECLQLPDGCTFEDNSICCDCCHKWCHFVCVNILDKDDDQLIEERWCCPKCT